jgi:RNA polymerase sigma factor (sigma-70 family)
LSQNKTEWLGSLLKTNEARLLRYARRWVSKEAAHDCVQETFLRLWKEDPNSLAGREAQWLFCVVRNLAFDALKKEGAMSKDTETAVDQAASTEESADVKMEHAQTQTAVLDKVARLPEMQQEVVRLKFQEGFSYNEISDITGHSVSYVGVLIHEAMTKLRAELVPIASATGEGGPMGPGQLKGGRR